MSKSNKHLNKGALILQRFDCSQGMKSGHLLGLLSLWSLSAVTFRTAEILRSARPVCFVLVRRPWWLLSVLDGVCVRSDGNTISQAANRETEATKFNTLTTTDVSTTQLRQQFPCQQLPYYNNNCCLWR